MYLRHMRLSTGVYLLTAFGGRRRIHPGSAVGDPLDFGVYTIADEVAAVGLRAHS